jgi:hypothetical protein
VGPELFGGIIRPWGLAGGLVSNQWDVAGSNDTSYSVLTAQYFYAIGLGQGWQIAASPVITCDWNADSDEALSLPRGIGLAKTTKIGQREDNGCQITGPLLLIGNPRPFGTEAVRQHLVRELLHGRDHVPLSGTGNGTFDFLGFTHYWARSRRGYWVIKRRTARKRLRRAMKSIWMS